MLSVSTLLLKIYALDLVLFVLCCVLSLTVLHDLIIIFLQLIIVHTPHLCVSHHFVLIIFIQTLIFGRTNLRLIQDEKCDE